MADNPGISVLMTTYNRERYVEAAIRSVLASTFSDFELIVVDDGSTDRTAAILEQLAAEDHRVLLHINPQNLGDYPNRNRAASLAKGKYLKYVDADDLIYPWGLQILWDCMEKHPDAGWGLCSLAQDTQRIFPFLLNPKEAYHYHYLGPGLFHKAPLSSIIRKSVFDEVGGFKPLRMVGDSEMWHRLAQDSPVLLMPHGIVWYRHHDDQESNVIHEFALTYQTITHDYLTSEKCPLDKNQLQLIYTNRRRRLMREIFVDFVKRDFKSVRSTRMQLRALKPFT